MAYTLIGGTAIGTVLILVFLPALYAILFGVKPPADLDGADQPMQKDVPLAASAPVLKSAARDSEPDGSMGRRRWRSPPRTPRSRSVPPSDLLTRNLFTRRGAEWSASTWSGYASA